MENVRKQGWTDAGSCNGYTDGVEGSGGKSTQMFYLSKSINTVMQKYSVISKSPEFKNVLELKYKRFGIKMYLKYKK